MVANTHRETEAVIARRHAMRTPFDVWLHAALARDYAKTLAEPLPTQWLALLHTVPNRPGRESPMVTPPPA